MCQKFGVIFWLLLVVLSQQLLLGQEQGVWLTDQEYQEVIQMIENSEKELKQAKTELKEAKNELNQVKSELTMLSAIWEESEKFWKQQVSELKTRNLLSSIGFIGLGFALDRGVTLLLD